MKPPLRISPSATGERFMFTATGCWLPSTMRRTPCRRRSCARGAAATASTAAAWSVRGSTASPRTCASIPSAGAHAGCRRCTPLRRCHGSSRTRTACSTRSRLATRSRTLSPSSGRQSSSHSWRRCSFCLPPSGRPSSSAMCSAGRRAKPLRCWTQPWLRRTAPSSALARR